MDGNILGEVPYDQTYPLHVGLHTYTSGLERLAKLALACHGFMQSGSFAEVRRYSHHIGSLLDAIEALDLSGYDTYNAEHLQRPKDAYEPDLVGWLERYSSGQGRYELLDSLSTGVAELPTWETWVDFCSRGSVSDNVRLSIAMRQASGDALRDVAAAHDLETVAAPHLEEFNYPISEASAAVGLAMYRRARWAASVLDAVSYYTHHELPILGEALTELRQTSDNFFAFDVAKLSDPEVVEEELINHRENFDSPCDDDEGDDVFDDSPQFRM